jgi:hypothetical protein
MRHLLSEGRLLAGSASKRHEKRHLDGWRSLLCGASVRVQHEAVTVNRR